MPKMTRLRSIPKEPPLLATPGESAYAVRSPKPWDDKDRTKPIWGLVVHTTGSGLPARAYRNGVYVTAEATRYYQRSHGTHYVVGPLGVQGDIIQVANERERANGVGTKETRAAIRDGDWTEGLPRPFVERWFDQWYEEAPGGVHSPIDLFPGSFANNVYIHAEMPPVVFYDGNTKRTTHEPFHRRHAHNDGRDLSKLRFTEAQHDAIILLALDIARRYDWPDRWWRTGRLVGHEDLSPHTRTHKFGGWDPGWQRNQPYFDFGYVVDEIERMST